MLSYIDRVFKGNAILTFGSDAIEAIPDRTIEACRCKAFEDLAELTKEYGKLPKGTVEAIFCDYIGEVLNDFSNIDIIQIAS